MNRLKIILPILLVCFIVLLLWLAFTHRDPDAPRYVPITTQPAGPFGSAFFSWGSAAPLAGGQVWIYSGIHRTNRHAYLFDLEQRKIVGELLNGSAVSRNQDQTKLFCQGLPGLDTTLKGDFVWFLSIVSGGNIRLKTNRIETFWILDLRHNSARRVGNLGQWPGTGSNWKPAPGFRFAYNVPNNGEEDTAFFLCDLEQETFHKIPLIGNLRGWWNDHQIVIRQPEGDLLLYDVLTKKNSTLFSHETIGRRFQELGITNNLTNFTTSTIWTGSNYEFTLTGLPNGSLYTNGSFILKLERAGPALALLYPNFQFKWLGTFNTAQTYYAYPGESGMWGRAGNGGLYLTDLIHTNTTSLVKPDNSGQYIIPRFYGDRVTYGKNGELWRMNLDGSGNTRLFPPPDK